MKAALAANDQSMTGFGAGIACPDISKRGNWDAGDLRYDVTIMEYYEGIQLKFPYVGKLMNLNKSDKCWIEPSNIYSNVDSLAMFQVDGFNIFNPNECEFNEKLPRPVKDEYGTSQSLPVYLSIHKWFESEEH